MGNRILIAAGAAFCAAAMVVAPASRANVTLGSDLAPAPSTGFGCIACTVLQTSLPGAQLSSPVTGTIVRWRVVITIPGGAGIRIVRPLGASRLFLSASSTSSVPTGAVTVPASLPISVGDRVALDLAAEVADNSTTPGAVSDVWIPQPQAGQAPAATTSPTQETYFNAEVEPTNTFTLGTPLANKKKGTATIDIALPNVGTVQVDPVIAKRAAAKGKRKKKRKPVGLIAPFNAASVGPGSVTLQLQPNGATKRKLKQTGKASGQISVNYTPDFGTATTQTASVSLRLSSAKKKKR